MVGPVFDTIASQLEGLAARGAVEHGTLIISIAPDALLALVQRLKSEWQFDMLLDVTAIDWPKREPRFDVVWHVYSTQHKVRVRVKTQVKEADPVVDSVTALYGAAGFLERECHEMYGIRFRGNADLRPILLKVYEQMCEPKWVMAFGVCATSGGFYQNYAALAGIDRVIPVDVYIPGCPPRPETVIDGIMQLQDKIAREKHMILTKDF